MLHCLHSKLHTGRILSGNNFCREKFLPETWYIIFHTRIFPERSPPTVTSLPIGEKGWGTLEDTPTLSEIYLEHLEYINFNRYPCLK